MYIYFRAKQLCLKVVSNDLAKDSLWALVGNVVGRGLSLLAGIFLANMLGQFQYGEYGLLRNTLLLIATFSTFGLGYTGTKFVSEYLTDIRLRGRLTILIRELLKITIYFSVLMAILAFLFASKLAVHLEDPQLETPIRVLSIIIVLNAMTTTQIGILAGLKLFPEMSRINILSGICNFILTLLLAYYYGFEGALWGLLGSQAINCLLNYRQISIFLRRNPSSYESEINVRDLRKSVCYYSLPIAVQEFSYSVFSWLSSLLLLKLTDYGELGVYSAVTQWTSVILFIPGVLRNITLSYISGTQEKAAQNKLQNKILLVNIMATVIPVLIILVSRNLITSFYHEEFQRLTEVLIWASLATIFQSLHNVFVSVYQAQSWNWEMFIICTLRDLLVLGLSYLLITSCQMFGSEALAISNLLSALFAFLFSWGFLIYRKK